MRHGVVAGYPVKGVRVRLFDGSYHTVDSSEMAFKIAGSMAMKEALERPARCCSSRSCSSPCSVPEDSGRRRDRRPQLAPRPAARHGADGRHDRGQGRGADGGDARPTRPTCARSPAARASTRWSSSRYEEVPVAPGAEGRRRSTRRRTEAVRACVAEPPLLRSLTPWRARATSARTSSTSPATSAGARSCAASAPRPTWPAASAARSASCAPRGPSTRAGSARTARDELTLRSRPPGAAGARFLDDAAPRRERAREVADEAAAERGRRARAGGAPRSRRRPDRRAQPAPRPRRADQRRAEDASARSRSSTPPSTPRTVGGVARSLGRPGGQRPPAPGPPERGRDRRDVGARPGTASRSTSPTRPAACARSRRATSSPSSTPTSRL